MRASRSVSISLIISFIAVFMYGNLFTNEADADCGIFTPVSQVAFGYLAGGGAFITACVVAGSLEEWEYGAYEKGASGTAMVVMSTAYVLVSSGTVYGIGQEVGCRGSFMWTLGGAVASPIVGGIIGGTLGGIAGIKKGIKEGNIKKEISRYSLRGSVGGSFCGFLLAPIGATIAYHRTKGKNNSDRKEIIVPLMSIKF